VDLPAVASRLATRSTRPNFELRASLQRCTGSIDHGRIALLGMLGKLSDHIGCDLLCLLRATASARAYDHSAARLVKCAFPRPVPMVRTPQRSILPIHGISLRPCTTASLCSKTSVS